MLKLNGTKPTWLIIQDVQRPLFPTVSQNTLSVSRKAGAYDFGNTIAEKVFTVKYIIKATSRTDLINKKMELQEWLYSEETKQLIFDDKPTIYYDVKFTGDSSVDDILTYGFGEFTLVAYNPFGQALTTKTLAYPLGEGGLTFLNTGQLDTKGQFEFVFEEDTTGFTLVNGDQAIIFGDLDVDKTPVDTKPLMFHDNCESAAGWTTASSLVSGTIVGNSFTSNGWSISANGYGDPDIVGWRNQSGIKSIGGQVQDFEARMLMGLHPTAVGQLGRVQFYGLTAEGERLFALSIRQGDPARLGLYAEAWIGNRKVYEGYGDYKGVWKDYADGRLDIARRGKQWSIYFAAVGADGKDHTRLTRLFTIGDIPLANKKLASIQVVIGANGANPAQYAYIADIKVNELNIPVSEDENPIMFKRGDVLLIDSETDGVYLNGTPFFEGLEPSSQFPIIKKGINQFVAIPENVVSSGAIKFRERYW